MNRKDEIKIKMLSEIDDGILEKNSLLRAKLLQKPRMNRKTLVSICAVAACLLLIGGSLLALIPLLTKQVPIYQGMTVEGSSSVSMKYDYPDAPTYLSVGMPTVFEGPKEDKEEREKKETLEEAVRDTLEVEGADAMYYAMPGEDVYVTIHISNPDDFEILSFTLNGKKYSSYMFEEGSNMENIVIKVNVGDAAGVSEYTIDAIKYVDGSQIKDVRMDGERTVRIGVYTENQPTVSVSKESISYAGVSFEALVEDPEGLIAQSEGNAIALLYSAGTVVEHMELPIGEKTAVSFENLKPDTEYQYAVAVTYDALDGTGFDVHVLYRKDFNTYPALSFHNVEITQTEVSFVLAWNAQMKEQNLTSLALYQNGSLVKSLALDAKSVGDLYSNTAYELVAEYLLNGVTERCSFSFTTEKKAEPKVLVADSDLSQNGFRFTFDDPDGVGSVTKIELLKNGSVIQALSDLAMRQFEGLTANTLYQLKVAYVYDLNDGKGTQSKEVTLSVATLPQAIEISQITTVGATLVTPGESVFLRVQLSNPDGVEIKSIEIGGKTLQLLKVGSYYECVYQVVSTGGRENITITGIYFVNAGQQTVMQNINYVNDSLILVAGQVTVESFYIEEYFHKSEETIVATVVFKGSEPYEIDSIVCDTNLSPWDLNPQKTFQLTKVSDTVYTVKLPWSTHANIVNCKISQIKMTGGATQEIEQDAENHQLFYVCMPFGEMSLENCTPISTPEQLQNMTSYGCYKLVNDIDLSGVSWEPYNLQYVYLDGNGYTIKNFSYSSKEEGKTVGMFTELAHCHFYNVVLENASIVLWDKPLCCGILAGCATSTIFEKCNVEGTIRCGANVENVMCGGFVGRYYRSSDVSSLLLPEGSVCIECAEDNLTTLRCVFLECVFKGTIEGSGLKKPCAFIRSGSAALIGCDVYGNLPLLMESKNSFVIDCNTYPYEP